MTQVNYLFDVHSLGQIFGSWMYGDGVKGKGESTEFKEMNGDYFGLSLREHGSRL